MLPRRLENLNWKTALGELLIIAAGVLIALAIDQWNADRLERKEERLVLQQLVVDVRSDIRQIEWIQQAVTAKEASLQRLLAALAKDPGEVDDVEFLADIVIGANFGWNQSKVERSTFDQLLGSGEFRVIENAELRRIIANYYTDWE